LEIYDKSYKTRTITAHFGLKMSGIFNNFFSDVIEIKNSFFKWSKPAGYQSIFARTDIPDNYFVSEFTIDNDHDKKWMDNDFH